MYGIDVLDETLTVSLKRGDARAFEMIYRKYWRQLFVYVYQQLGSKEESKEILQDLMLSLWQNREESNIQNLKAFLFIAARNLVNMRIRREINVRKYQEYKLMQEVFETIESDFSLQESDLMRAIESALEKLPEKTALVFRLNKLDHLSIDKIASQMGLSDKAVKYHLTKSVKVVKAHLRAYLSEN